MATKTENHIYAIIHLYLLLPLITLDDINKEIKQMGYPPVVPKTERPNFYRIDDGAILRVFPIVNNVFMDPNNPNGAAISAQNVIAIFVPQRLRGTPSDRTYSNTELQANIENSDIGFEPLIENFNVYEIDGKWILSVKTTVSQVTKTRLFDIRGEPIYIVNTAPIPKLKPK